MAEKEKTPVEWFLENLRNLIKESELTDMRPSEFDAREMELLEQAKEMEKERLLRMSIKTAICERKWVLELFGDKKYVVSINEEQDLRETALKHYNETFFKQQPNISEWNGPYAF
jgi:hypothetical protein